jgi:DNA transformation protein
MRITNEFAEHAAELLSAVGTVVLRRMFGGYGLFCDGVMFALIAGDELYLKTDAHNRAEFERVGCTPFVYGNERRRVVMSYFRAPDEAIESRELATPWARSAFDAALRGSQSAKTPSARGGGRLTRKR